jgi:hypothetical protein
VSPAARRVRCEAVTDDPDAPGADDGLDPPLARRRLAPKVEQARAFRESDNARYEELARQRIEGHFAVYAMAVDRLADAHQQVVDVTDLDLMGETRPAAVWQVAGRCIGYARALLVLAREGIGDEGLPVARSLHEADLLLEALVDFEEGELVRQWLADRDDAWVRPRHTRAAVTRIEARLDEKMREAGAEPIPGTGAVGRDLYHRMSLVAHNRREGLRFALAPRLRTMTRGPHTSVFGRAIAVSYAGTMVEEAVAHVGEALIRFYGPSFLGDVLRPTLESFAAIRSDMPLEEAALRAHANSGDG